MKFCTPDKGWIVPAAQRRLTPDRYHPGHRPDRVKPIEAFIWHYAVGGTKAGVVGWLTRRDDTYVSAHFVVGKDGAITQLAPLTDRCIHAGGGTSKLFGRGAVNDRTVGAELVNWGPLTRHRGRLVNAYGNATGVEVEDVVEIDGQLWDAYTEAQMQAACDLACAVAEAVPVLRDPERHLGHTDVDPARKRDPGPHFDWHRLRRALRPAPTPAGCRLT